MLRVAIQWGIITAALAAPLVGACDDHEAEQCQYIGTCPLPDAGDGGGAIVGAADGGDH
jgi:hypothetical protein